MKAASIRPCSPASPEMGVDVVTFGCRLNAFESEVIRHEAERAGLSDTIVINSCAVTNEAVAQARQSIRRLKRERPQARIVVTGCAAQTQSRMFADMAEVDRVVGNDDKMRAVGRSRRSRRMFCRACATASLVTAQVLTTMVSVRPARSASRRITSDSNALRRQPKVTTSTLMGWKTAPGRNGPRTRSQRRRSSARGRRSRAIR